MGAYKEPRYYGGMNNTLLKWRDLEFDVGNRQVYPPKPASLFFSEKALEIAKPGIKFLDACAGSGVVGIAVAKYVPNVSVTVSDISAVALQTAQENAIRNNVSVTITASDMYSAFKESSFDLIAVHPPAIPYLPGEDWGMTEGMRLATFGGGDGSLLVERSISEARVHLAPGGALLLLLPHWSNVPKAMSLLDQQYEKVKDLGSKEVEFFPVREGVHNPILIAHLKNLASEKLIDMEFPTDGPPRSSVTAILAYPK